MKFGRKIKSERKTPVLCNPGGAHPKFGRQEGWDESSVTLTSRLSWGRRFRPETSYKLVDVLVVPDESVEKLVTELSVDALMCCLFLFLKREMTSAAHGERHKVFCPEIELSVGTVHVASFAFQAFLVMDEQMTLVCQFVS